MTVNKLIIRPGITAAIFLFALTGSASAQKHEKRTIILNGGSRITGTIIADSAGSMKLRLTSPQVISLNEPDVLLIMPVQSTERSAYGIHGYSFRFSASVLTGHNSDGGIRSLSLHLSNGYRFRNGLGAGIGMGLEEMNVVLLPVYADLRYHPFRSRRVSPFMWIKSGYGFPLKEDDYSEYYYGYYSKPEGGLMFSTGAGLAVYSWLQTAVYIGIGYRYQKISFRQEYPWSERTDNELVTHFNRFEIQLGFIFR